MSKKLFVGNLPYTITGDDLKNLFATYGNIIGANIVIDKFTQRSKGFGFVEFEKDEDALAAIQALDQSEQGERKIAVKEAIPRP